MNHLMLRKENKVFEDTMGVSQANGHAGFVPAFRDMTTGRVEFARFRSGEIAPIHLIEGLPMAWAVSWNRDGCVTELRPDIISGFVRDTRFYTREEVIALAS